MSARLIEDMEAEATKLNSRAALYYLSGEGALGHSLHLAAVALRTSAVLLSEAHAAEGEAINRAKEA